MIRIAVANPGQIPGGLETVQQAMLKHFPKDQFELVPCKIWQWRRFRAYTSNGVGHTASNLAYRALHKCQGSHLAVAYAFGKEKHRIGKQDFFLFEADVSAHSRHLSSSTGMGSGEREEVSAADAQELFESSVRNQSKIFLSKITR